jgi:hypothetical protein
VDDPTSSSSWIGIHAYQCKGTSIAGNIFISSEAAYGAAQYSILLQACTNCVAAANHTRTKAIADSGGSGNQLFANASG